MMLIRFVGLFLGLILIYFTYVSYKRKKLSLKEFVFWSLIWSGMCALSLFSNLLQPLSQSLKIIRVFDLLFILSIILLFILMFLTRTDLRKNREKTDKIIETIALENKKQK